MKETYEESYKNINGYEESYKNINGYRHINGSYERDIREYEAAFTVYKL